MRTRAAALVTAGALVALAGAGCRSRTEKEKALAGVAGLGAVPASADVIIGADVPAMARSTLVERAVARMLQADPGLSGQLDQLWKDCGLEPSRDLREVLIAMDTDATGAGAADRIELVATGKLAEASLAACVGRQMGEVGGTLVQKPVVDRTAYHATVPGKTDVWFAFGKPDTVLVSSSVDFLTEALGKGPRLADDAEMARLIEKARVRDAALWAAGKVAPAVGEGLKQASGGQVGAPRAMFAHLVLTTGVELVLGAEMSGADEANKLVSLAKTQLAVLAQIAQKWKLGRLVQKVTVQAAGATVEVHLAMTEEELRAALAPVDSAAPGEQNPAPPSQQPGNQGAPPHGQGDAAPGGQAPVQDQGQPH